MTTSIDRRLLPASLNVMVTRFGRASGAMGNREVSTDHWPIKEGG
jgi:hypothetical protein